VCSRSEGHIGGGEPDRLIVGDLREVVLERASVYDLVLVLSSMSAIYNLVIKEWDTSD
jgi:hypothetical protein